MIINIKRFDGKISSVYTYTVNETNLLKALEEIKTTKDSSLTYRCGCRSGVCGSCALRVNGVEKLACKTKINDEDLIEPLKNSAVVKDLISDVSHETLLIKNTNSYIDKSIHDNQINQNDINLIDRQSNCILCNSCYSSCPVYEVNKEFIGPFALSRTLRYVNDKREGNKTNKLDSIQKNGIWDCTLCGACTLVCPQNIDPKNDILQLQNISVQNGYSNPQFDNFNMSFGNDDFGGF